MASVTVKHLIDIIMKLLQDEDDNNVWDEQELVNYYNLAVREIISLRPDDNGTFEIIKLASGVKQQAPAKTIKLIRCIRNMGTDGATPGRQIHETTFDMLAAVRPDLSTVSGQSEIQDYCKAEDNVTFYVYPPADGTSYIEIEIAKVPDQLVWDAGGNWQTAQVAVAEQFVESVKEYILAKAYQKDTDIPGNESRAADHYKKFLLTVGIDIGE